METLLNDILKDGDRSIKEGKSGYMITSKVNYPNNSELVSQTITFNDKNLLTGTTYSGEVVQYANVLGILTDTSLNWSNNGKEYYIIGESLTPEELLQIASSTATVAITK